MIKLPGHHLRADLGNITQKIGDKNPKKGAGAPLERLDGGVKRLRRIEGHVV
jgi:hypothetical protein